MDRSTSNEEVFENDEDEDKKPRPEDFDAYVPWACTELQINVNVVIDSITLEKPTGFQLKAAKSKIRTKISATTQIDTNMRLSADSVSLGNVSGDAIEEVPKVKISATHDPLKNLILLKFIKNTSIPCQVFKVIELLLPYHRLLTNIVINQGLDQQGLHQLIKIVNYGLITDLTLDNTAIIEGWYDLILEKRNKLKNLSLARCKIEDETAIKIAGFLVHPMPASYTLQILNLASNLVTDDGAKELSIALRSNRRLTYLNLCDNRISDDSAILIFETLVPFLVTNKEIDSYRRRKQQYITNIENLTQQIIQEIKSSDFEKKNAKKTKAPVTKKTKEEKGQPAYNDTIDLDNFWYDKAKMIAIERVGEFSEPFDRDKRFVDNDLDYSYGNNILAYLNLAYNRINYATLKKILQILQKQQELKRKPIGLINVVLEGNNIPQSCSELGQIDSILLSNIPTNKKLSAVKSKK